MSFEWTEERILEAIRMQQRGFTTYQIAAHFRISRNAVCGKLFREKARRGLTTPVSPSTQIFTSRQAQEEIHADPS